MRHAILVLMLTSIASANPKYLAIRVNSDGIVEGYHGCSEATTPDGMVLIPWTDMSRPDLVPKPDKRFNVRHYRIVGGQLQKRPDADVDAEDLAIRKEESRQSLLALKARRRELAEDAKDGDATQADLDTIDSAITAKRAEINRLR